MELRKELQWFATEMESKLKENDYKGGWKKCDIWWLVNKLKTEVYELEKALEEAHEEKEELTEISEDVISECADVANFAMMIADRIGALRQPAVISSLLTCVDCGKSDDTVKDRGAFNGIQCYECKKNQDIEDDECR